MIEVPYYNELVQIRKLLEEEVPCFPRFGCQTDTRLTSLIINIKGTAGRHTPSNNTHCWPHDVKRGLYISLSMDQFDNGDEPITILPDSTEILIEDPKIIERYNNVCNRDSFIRLIKRLCKLYEEKYGRVCPTIKS